MLPMRCVQLEEASSMLGKVKLWIQLMVPRIEDGNNFGVAVQEECSGEVRVDPLAVVSYLAASSLRIACAPCDVVDRH